jgi:hypothetical protein
MPRLQLPLATHHRMARRRIMLLQGGGERSEPHH